MLILRVKPNVYGVNRMFLKSKPNKTTAAIAAIAIAITGFSWASPVAANAVTTTSSGNLVTHNYDYSNAVETLTVPANVTSIEVTMYGGEGARGGLDSAGPPPSGNYVGAVTGTIPVNPGDKIKVAVGSGAANSEAYNSCSAGYAADSGDPRVSVGGTNPLAGYDGGNGGAPGQDGCSGYGGAGGAASVLMIGTDADEDAYGLVVAAGGGGNGGSGQWAEIHGKISLSNFVAAANSVTPSTNGEPGKYVYRACIEAGQGRCDGGGGAGGGGGYAGGGRGILEFGQGSFTEWFGHGGSPGQNFTSNISTLSTSYTYSATNTANGSIRISYSSGTPSQPTGLVASAGNANADIYWSAPSISGASAITGYKVEFAAGPGFSSWTEFTGCTTTATSCAVTGLTNGTAYKFRVSAINALGTGSPSALSNEVTPGGVAAAPTIDAITAGDGQLTVAFTAPASNLPITNYQYSLNGGSTWVSAGTNVSPLTISGLLNGTVYAVRIRAVSLAGDGQSSTDTNATPSALPGAPTITNVSPGGDGTSLVVTFVAGFNGGTSISDYEYALSPGENTTNFGAYVSSGTTSPFTVSGLQSGSAYTVQLRAKNSAGYGPGSAFRTGVTLARPNAPVISTLAPSDQQLTVTYTAYTDATNGGSPISKIEYSTDNGSTWTNAGTLANPFVISGLTNGTSYSVKLRATNAIGVSSASASVTGVPAAAPTAPRAVTVSAGQESVSVSWSAPSSNNGSEITGYSARAYTASTGGSPAATCSSTTTSCVISGLTNGTLYFIDVVAINAAGTSVASAPRISSRPAALPGAPTIGTVTAGNTYLSVAFTPGSADANAPITGYQYSLDGGTSWLNTNATASPILITGLTNGTTYSVKIRARSDVGNGAASGSASGKPFSVPDAVAAGSITYVANNGSVDVTWLAPNNNGATITSYEVTAFTASLGGGIAQTCSTTGALTCQLQSLSNGTTYYVSIQAVNSAGYSPRSNPRVAVRPGTASTVTLASSSSAIDVGGSVTLTATVTTGATGTVNFIAGNNSITSCSAVVVSSGTATCTTTALPVGSVLVKANYSGDGTYSSSESSARTIAVAAQPQTISFAGLTNKVLGESAFALSATGGASSNAVVFSSATPNVCSTGGANGAIVTMLNAGTCTLNANQAGNSNYAAATQVSRSFEVTVRYTVSFDVNRGTSTHANQIFTTGDSGITLPTPIRANFVFTGWYTDAIAGTRAGGAGDNYIPTSGGTLYARWVQNSLYGMGTSTKIGTMTTVAGLGTNFQASGPGSTVAINYQADALPASTVIDVYLLADTARAQRVITNASDFVVSLVVAWLATDLTVPSTAAGKPLTMTINNSSIRAGAVVYAVVGDVATEVGRATEDGTVTIEITDDPEIAIANRVGTAANNQNGGGGSTGTDSNSSGAKRETKLTIGLGQKKVEVITTDKRNGIYQLKELGLQANSADKLSLAGNGMKSLTELTVTAVGIPELKATAVANESGEFEVSIALNANIEPGEHILEISGLDADGVLVKTSLVMLLTPDRYSKAISFKRLSSKLTSLSKARLAAAAKAAKVMNSATVTVRAYVPANASAKTKAVAAARLKQTVNYLKAQGAVVKFRMNSKAKSTGTAGSSSANVSVSMGLNR